MKKQLVTLFAAAVLALPAVAQTTGTTQVPVGDYTVFVDPPTGFVFVKLPVGWKFVGKVEQEALAKLPATVVTSLLRHEQGADAIDVARRTPVNSGRSPGNG